ncbi:MAG: hemolysin family protein [Fusobacteriaceae bacterium]
MDLLTKILTIGALIVISAFFSISEISLAASRKIKLQIMSEGGSKNAEQVLKLQELPGHFFTVVQIGLNIVAILAGSLGDNILDPYFTDFFIRYFPDKIKMLSQISSTLSFFLITAVVVEFADLIPKRIGLLYPEQIAVVVVGPMRFMLFVFKPIVMFFNGLANMIFRIFKLPEVREELITHEEIFAVVDAGAVAGILHKKEHHLIENVFELDSRWVSSAMTTRDEIVYFSLKETEESLKEKIAEAPHSKYLVCREELDSIYGYLDSKDILPRLLKGEKSGLGNIEDITNKKILIVPNTLTLSDVLDRFNETYEDFAVVLNEYGHVVGLITLKDIISTLMGDVVHPFQDEYIIKRSDDSWLIDGLTPIEDVKKVLDIDHFPEEDSYETIAGFMMYSLKSIPKRAARLEYEDYTFEVVDVDNYKVDQLLVTKGSKKNENQSAE